MRVVIDTNVLISGIFWGGIPFEILDLWVQDKTVLLTSQAIVSEYARVLQEYGLKRNRTDLTEAWLHFIVQHSHIIHTHRKFHVCRDAADDMYLDCAVEGSAAYIISGDKDLLTLRDFMGVKIVNPHDFANNFKAEK
jgi:uncharacterized protein